MKTSSFIILLFIFSSNILIAQTDTLIDTRDGQIYKTIQIGNQFWMAENINLKIDDSFCYQNNPANCDIYGRLYQWESAKEVCPEGWHLPSDNEWQILESELGMNSLDTAKGDSWRGTDQATQLLEGGKTSFNAKLGGYKNPPSNYFLEGMHAFFWTSTPTKNGYRTWYRQMIKGNPQIMRHNQAKSWGLSVRCVKD